MTSTHHIGAREMLNYYIASNCIEMHTCDYMHNCVYFLLI